MKSAMLVALVCMLRIERSESFMVSGGVTRGACSFKRKRGRPQQQQHQQHQQRVSRRIGSSLMQAPGGGAEWEGKLFELDVVEYRMAGQNQGPGEDRVELASYIGDGKLHPLLTRAESGPRLFFHDEDAPTVSLAAGSCQIVRILDEVSYSQRIVEDRVKNPHGEEAEDCFLIEGTLNPALVIRVET